ncbi:hypothetical protein B0H67DRAFT_578182 [Lasiosphaeris hirsuta]|uniref:DDE Tnp4 domain-containing protein n=1 Tax=Lasiosphaeris hirsuta TaxID=260670 RepID=A0AA40ASF0_9PEZI|nr:hypothetical protein B0H67DRAFT_578182 [Lasiosphaeris hirsuta]
MLHTSFRSTRVQYQGSWQAYFLTFCTPTGGRLARSLAGTRSEDQRSQRLYWCPRRNAHGGTHQPQAPDPAEQEFGMLKRKWKIVRIVPIEYSIEKQVQIVYAVTGLHNFPLARREKDEIRPAELQILSLARVWVRRVVRRRHPDIIPYYCVCVMGSIFAVSPIAKKEG